MYYKINNVHLLWLLGYFNKILFFWRNGCIKIRGYNLCLLLVF